VTALLNTRPLDIPALNGYLADRGMTLANGYGRLKDKTFRIGHMGEIHRGDLEVLLNHIDEFIARQAVPSG
jgi:aspartate aminotransferase-like enzyme